MKPSILAAAALTLAALAAACSRADGARAPSEAVVPVRTAPVEREAIARPVRATGTLHARDEVQLSFKIGGVLARVHVAEGARVRRGQPLATLDPSEIDAQVSRARSGLAKAERDFARAEALFRDSVATLQQLQDARTGMEVARSDVQAAEFNRRYATIVAPADGVILRRSAEPGELVAPGVPVLTLAASTRGMVLRAGVADHDALRLRPGEPAVVRFDALPGREFAGRVTEVGPSADPRTGTYRLEVGLTGDDVPLVSGLVGRAEVVPSTAAELAVVPVEALLEADGDRATVYTLGPEGRARRVPVSVAFVEGARVALSGGAEGVDRVVTDGAAYLRDGSAVEVVP